MSKEIGYIQRKGREQEELFITSFYGGSERGACIQLTAKEEGFGGSMEINYIQICFEDYYTLRKILDRYFDKHKNKEWFEPSKFVKEGED